MLPCPGLHRDPAAQRALERAVAAKPPGYLPRSRHTTDGAPHYVNRLIGEASPYLLQHAHNPVDWWPWGEAAFAEAARRGLPVFLSAGYATCHWCHVMEDESFDDPEVAAFLNARFVPVKLDREQRPDIDHLYILATTLQHRHAGWPNSCFLTATGKPFHTGTYFPKSQFLTLLHAVEKAWSDNQPQLEAFAEDLSRHVQGFGKASPGAADLSATPGLAASQLVSTLNRKHGGFSTGTQFPNEGHILFLLDHWQRSGDPASLNAALTTLDAIAAGGIHDHAGGGFHRYATDVDWRTPHFEKMLYNQALLIRCLTAGWLATGRQRYAHAVRRCVSYLTRDMMEADGTFAAAEDADSLNPEGGREEGAFYAWTSAAFTACLGPEAERWSADLGLNQPPTLEAGAVIHLEPGTEPDPERDAILARLAEWRSRRPRPFRDSKVIGGWNGLVIRALAEAGASMNRPDWIALADRALTALLARLTTATGLARLHAGGAPLEAANLTDHAWIALAALALADAGVPGWAERLPGLADAVLAFGSSDGRLALSLHSPLGPVFEAEDGAVPSGESSALEFLALLNQRQPDPARRQRAQQLRDALSGAMAAMPVIRLTGLAGTGQLDSPSGWHQVHADGTLCLQVSRDDNGLWLTVTIAPGWHLAGGGDGLTALTLSGADTALPEPDGSPPGHTGTLRLQLANHGPLITFSAQPCSDSFCLAPVLASFRFRP